jgi:hypothetical protein
MEKISTGITMSRNVALRSLVTIDQITRRHIPEEHNLLFHCYGKLILQFLNESPKESTGLI